MIKYNLNITQNSLCCVLFCTIVIIVKYIIDVLLKKICFDAFLSETRFLSEKQPTRGAFIRRRTS